MIVTAWNNGSHHESGAGYGLKIEPDDRDRYFKREWGTVILELEGFLNPVEVNIDKDSFWGPKCRELISQEVGVWLRENGLAPWGKGKPPKLGMEKVDEQWFSINGLPSLPSVKSPQSANVQHAKSQETVPAPYPVPPAPVPVYIKRCPTCNAETVPGTVFCDNCGQDLRAAPSSPVYSRITQSLSAHSTSVKETVCIHCGHKNLPGSAFCENCGTPLAGNIPVPSPPSPALQGCPTCNAPTVPGAVFCDNCGQDLRAVSYSSDYSRITQRLSAHSTSSKETVCIHCGYKNLPGSAFCENCGTPLTEQSVPTNYAPDLPNRINCHNCDYPNIADSAYCENCGAIISKLGTKQCPFCGVQTVPGAVFCDNCGYDLRPTHHSQGLRDTFPVKEIPQKFLGSLPELTWRNRLLFFLRGVGNKLRYVEQRKRSFSESYLGEDVLFIPLTEKFKFIHEPYQWESSFPFLGREREINTLAQRILFSEGGAILVTGYRGVGKTSLVNRAVNMARNMMPELLERSVRKELLYIHFNLAREMNPDEIMHHIIRRIYDTLRETGLIKKFGKDTRRLTELAYSRTSTMMSRKTGYQQYAELGLSLPDLVIGPSKLKSPFTMGRKFSNSSEEQTSFLSYDDKAAEYDIIKLLRRLASRPRSFGSRPAIKIVIAFDELDKISPTVTKDDKLIPNPYLDSMIGVLKSLLTTSSVVFIFIASREIHQRWLLDLKRSDSVYDSVFAHQLYINCDWSFPQSLLEEYRTNKTPEYDPIEKRLAGYLRFKSRGIVRRTYRTLNQIVSWHESGLQIAITRDVIQQIDLFDRLDRILRENEQQILSPIQSRRSVTALTDEYKTLAYRLTDVILETDGLDFSIADLLNHMEAESIWINHRSLVELINIILDILLTANFVEKVDEKPSCFAQVYTLSDEKFFEQLETQYHLTEWALLRLQSMKGSETEQLDHLILRTLGGFRLRKKVGEGKFSEVFLAYDPNRQIEVAIKLARERTGGGLDPKDVLVHEGKLLSRINLPGVIRLFEIKAHTEPYYLVVEHVEGINLQQIVKNSRSGLELETAIAIIRALANIIINLHDQEIMQLDLKPSNFLLTRSGDIKLVDINSAILDDQMDGWKHVIGTPEYIAPEIKELKSTGTIASDVYSFGLMIYELFTGSLPTLNSLNMIRSGYKPGSKATTSLSSRKHSTKRVEGIPSFILDILKTALAKEPAERYKSVSEMLNKLPEFSMSMLDIASEIFSETYREDTFSNSSTQALLADMVNFQPITNKLKTARHGGITGVSSTQAYAGFIPSSPYPASEQVRFTKTTVNNLTPQKEMMLFGLTKPFQDSYRLDSASIKVGRKNVNQIILQELSISRIHAEIVFHSNGSWYLNDLNSASGTFLNNERINSPTKLSQGDDISFGRFHFRFDTPQDFSTPPTLSQDKLIIQRYKIIDQIGKGGMSNIYKATDIRLANRIVAIKELQHDGTHIEEFTDAFVQEARLLSHLDHPNIVNVYDFLIEETNYLIVMEYIEGINLYDHLEQNPNGFPEEKVLIWAKQLCDALHYLHTRIPPIVFRDMKPGNIMLLKNDKVKLIDFGISRLFGPEKIRDTTPLGTPGYAAPEQYNREQQSTPKTDIYGLGVTLHSLLTGYDPANSPFQVPDAKSLKQNISSHVSDALRIAYQSNPKDRYSSALEFWAALIREPQSIQSSEASNTLVRRLLNAFRK